MSDSEHGPNEPYSSGYLVTFDNREGATIGQTDILGQRPSSSVIGNMLATAPQTDMDMSMHSATVTYVKVSADGSVIDSEIVAIIWSTL